jgi:hypothetical protein
LSFFILDRIDANDQLRQELDEIVGGLQGYLSNVKNQGMKRQRDYESVLGEKAVLQQKVGKLEQELAILDTEAKRFKEMEKVQTKFISRLMTTFK